MVATWNRRKYTREQFIRAWQESPTIAECARRLGMTVYGSTYSSLRAAAKECGLNEDHMTGSGWNTGERYRPILPARDINEFLVEDSYHSSSHLKMRLLREGLLAEECAICGLGPEWQEMKLSLQLDHINGNNRDNRIENLRILCPNCHTQTDTFCSKRRGAVVQPAGDTILKRSTVVRSNRPGPTCGSCGKKSRGEYCKPCFNMNRTTKITWPTNEELLDRLAKSNYTKLAKELGVSDNAIRKRLAPNGVY